MYTHVCTIILSQFYIQKNNAFPGDKSNKIWLYMEPGQSAVVNFTWSITSADSTFLPLYVHDLTHAQRTVLSVHARVRRPSLIRFLDLTDPRELNLGDCYAHSNKASKTVNFRVRVCSKYFSISDVSEDIIHLRFFFLISLFSLGFFPIPKHAQNENTKIVWLHLSCNLDRQVQFFSDSQLRHRVRFAQIQPNHTINFYLRFCVQISRRSLSGLCRKILAGFKCTVYPMLPSDGQQGYSEDNLTALLSNREPLSRQVIRLRATVGKTLLRVCFNKSQLLSGNRSRSQILPPITIKTTIFILQR